jgi:secreted Zn-dependent insulinase-like peptidase
MASLNFGMSLYHDNLQFSWSGFNDSMPNFLDESLKLIRNINMKE